MEERVLTIIKAIRESFGGSVAIYTQGNCYQFYEILKAIFPEAEAYESGHVFTKIDGQFYDIRGKLDKELDLRPITDPERIKCYCVNKSTDEKVQEISKKFREDIINSKFRNDLRNLR